MTLDRVIRHTVVFHLSTSTYIPNFIGIGKTFCGRTDRHLRLTLLGRLFGVDLKKIGLKISASITSGRMYFPSTPLPSPPSLLLLLNRESEVGNRLTQVLLERRPLNQYLCVCDIDSPAECMHDGCICRLELLTLNQNIRREMTMSVCRSVRPQKVFPIPMKFGMYR